MSGVLKVSEAASLGLHSMVVLADSPGKPVRTCDIAGGLGISEAHLSKVLQRLSRAGLVKSVRGPKGGFVLAKPADDIALLEVYEAIDGPLAANACLFGSHGCGRGECIFGSLLETMTQQVREYLSTTHLANLAGCAGASVGSA